MAEKLKSYWNKIDYEVENNSSNPHEANYLKLDCSKAHIQLKWKPIWNLEKALEMTALWYKNYYENGKINSLHNLKEYVEDARKNGLRWSNLGQDKKEESLCKLSEK